MKKLEIQIINRIAKILKVNKSKIIEKKNFSEYKEWDSLSHLELITFLDEILEKKLREKIKISQN